MVFYAWAQIGSTAENINKIFDINNKIGPPIINLWNKGFDPLNYIMFVRVSVVMSSYIRITIVRFVVVSITDDGQEVRTLVGSGVRTFLTVCAWYWCLRNMISNSVWMVLVPEYEHF